MAEVSSSSLRQNNLTKTIEQVINDCLFILMKFDAMDHASLISFDAKNGSFVHMAYRMLYG